MKKCPMCGSEDLRRSEVCDVIDVGGIRFEGAIQGLACSCGEAFLDSTDVGKREKQIARWLAMNGIAACEAFRYMQRALGMLSVDLADLFGVTEETVSHWEHGKYEVPRNATALLAAIVLDDGCGRTDTVDRLRNLSAPCLSPCTVRVGEGGSLV